ncbi:DNA-directed RNA polymerase subunit alpha C-terminal domain-containing protein [Aureliella helgolandensis]|uniref:DNA-directed RNA polymerase subunit alpha n=1 Tax=Aureliella helgolandensis TaxID=2527968 RepID=A0A518G5T8_9BACT|nr:DNA-directed RNA polymerase subunit alpha C-terminal domain-containing protein [Aureliella helgolandensis]QDV23948.1 DNA-directed RNA polymerase subunit alpha [Aureliella helgolandensis]
MTEAPVLDVKDMVVSNQSFGPNEIKQICKTISEDYSQLGVLRDAVGELAQVTERSPAQAVRLGVSQYLVGKFSEARETLSHADGGALALYYLAKTNFQLDHYEEALKFFDSAKMAGYDADQCQIASAEVLRYLSRLQDAMDILDNIFGPAEQTAEYNYQRGATVAVRDGHFDEVLRLYNRALQYDDHHPGALFGLASENDRKGNDEEALMLYERAASCFPAHIGTLINLGIIYEDRNDFSKAQACYKRVLDVFPDHPRARLYMKDASASGNVHFDEDAARQTERLSQLLSISVNDFELSVRSRNCLQKMGVETLGDLVRTSEQQLLSSKNFGETSLVEIREMLSSKGLSLGQLADQQREPDPPLDTSGMTPDQQAVLDRPISDLNLSVRARKCMVRLGINTISELIRKTGDDLLESKNFGVTSLNEVREKLEGMELKLRGD